jgi:hypothetical protein
MEKIKNFVKVINTSGSSSGSGAGAGARSSDGSGYGDGYGYGSGSGSGDGYDDGSGSGSGDGSGDGSNYGYGDGSGSGSGSGLKTLNNQKIYLIDGVQTIIKSVKGNVAKGFIVESDLTLSSCFIVKGENKFAHGKTTEEAVNSLQEKLLICSPTEERIEKFKNHFSKVDEKYKASEFYTWHYLLTGSCDLGRKSFCKDKNIDLEKDTLTVSEFIKLVENSYGSNVINQLKKSYE